MVIAVQFCWSARDVLLNRKILYVHWFHGEIVEDLKRIEVSSEDTPFLFGLIVGTEIRFVVLFIVTVGCFLGLTVPFDGAIAVTGDVICFGDGFPLDSSAGVPGHSRCIANCLYFSLVQIVDLGFSIRATDCNRFLIVGVDLQAKDFSVYISEEIY